MNIRRYLVSTTERCQYTLFFKLFRRQSNLLSSLFVGQKWKILRCDWSDRLSIKLPAKGELRLCISQLHLFFLIVTLYLTILTLYLSIASTVLFRSCDFYILQLHAFLYNCNFIYLFKNCNFKSQQMHLFLQL